VLGIKLILFVGPCSHIERTIQILVPRHFLSIHSRVNPQKRHFHTLGFVAHQIKDGQELWLSKCMFRVLASIQWQYSLDIRYSTFRKIDQTHFGLQAPLGVPGILTTKEVNKAT
jgi:hypothetical protein